MVKEQNTVAPVVNFNRGRPGKGGGSGDGSGMEDMFLAMLLGIFKDLENSMEFFCDEENMKSKICYKLIPQEQLSELGNVPHRMIYDMALIYAYIYLGSYVMRGDSIITEKDMEQLGMTEPELFEEAKKNTPNILKAVIESMDEIPDFVDEEEQGIEAIYAVTNESSIYGSTSLIYEGLLKEIADANLGKEFVIYAGSCDFSLVFVVDPTCTDNIVELIKKSMKEIQEEHNYSTLSNLVYSINKSGGLELYDEL